MREHETRPSPRVIDFHTHAFPPWLRDGRDRYLETDATFGELFSNPRAKMPTADELVEAMDADGVDASVVMGMGWTDHGLAVEVNDYLAESVRRYPGRLYGFGGVSPAWGERAAREAERCAAAGLVGVGELHPDTQGYDIGDEAGDGASDGGGATPGPHRDHSLVGAGGPSLPRQGRDPP